MSEQSGGQPSLLAWFVGGGLAFLATVVAAFRWIVRTIAAEVISEHNADANAHRAAAEKNHAQLESDIAKLVRSVNQMHEDVALLIQAHNQAVEGGNCPAKVRCRRSTDSSDDEWAVDSHGVRRLKGRQ